MIELVDPARCTGCNICVAVCPTRVFDAAAPAARTAPGSEVAAVPAIARQGDCQTCFMCELYCPVDALYVAPQTVPLADLAVGTGLPPVAWGSYRRAVGWHEQGGSTAGRDQSYHLLGASLR